MTDTECPSEDELATFMDGGGAEGDREVIERHLDGCAACRDVLAMLAETFVPPEGSRIGRYELGRELGRGAMGVVYEALDPVLARRVALKIIHAEGAETERLLREGRALARVEHANVVSVHDAGVDGERVFLAMQLVVGETMRARLGKMPLDDVAGRLALFAEAAAGLSAAHAAGVVHQDFKPENVLVGVDGRVRVTDFGLARPLALGEDRAPTSGDLRWLADRSTRGVAGTPAYAAPEQLDGRAVDARSDQFAFGVALYEALFVHHPFGLGQESGPRTIAELRAKMNEGPATPPKAALLPGDVWPLVARMLRIEPRERWPSMDEVRLRLRSPGPRTVRRLRVLFVASAILTVLQAAFTLGVIVSALGPEEGPEHPITTTEAILGVATLAWLVLSIALPALAAEALARRRSSAYRLAIATAVVLLPTGYGALFAPLAGWLLSRPDVRAALGRDLVAGR